MNDVTSFEVGSVLDMKGIVQDQSVDAVRFNRRSFDDQIAQIQRFLSWLCAMPKSTHARFLVRGGALVALSKMNRWGTFRLEVDSVLDT